MKVGLGISACILQPSTSHSCHTLLVSTTIQHHPHHPIPTMPSPPSTLCSFHPVPSQPFTSQGTIQHHQSPPSTGSLQVSRIKWSQKPIIVSYYENQSLHDILRYISLWFTIREVVEMLWYECRNLKLRSKNFSMIPLACYDNDDNFSLMTLATTITISFIIQSPSRCLPYGFHVINTGIPLAMKCLNGAE